MFTSLKKLFKESDTTSPTSNGDLHLLCGLMIEAANIDGSIDEDEINKISTTLVENFQEDIKEVEKEIKKCLIELNNSKSLYFFTSRINKTFSNDKKIFLIEVLWEIILADKKIHDFESNLIRRLSGLLYISNIDCGNAKKKALEKISN